MPETRFRPGFRLSTIDVVVLIAGGAASALACIVGVWLAVAIAFVVLHFFLFCNVLRLSRSLELVWAGIFLALAAAATVFDLLGWPAALGVALVATIVLAVIEVRRPSYHGVGWRTLNPKLPEWWQATMGDPASSRTLGS